MKQKMFTPLVLVYHQINPKVKSAIAISPRRFKAQINYLKQEGFIFKSIAELFSIFSRRKDVGEKVVSITFDDGYKDIFDCVYPLLSEKQIPFTVFLSTTNIATDQPAPSKYLTGAQIKELKSQGVDFQDHGFEHQRLRQCSDEMIRQDIRKSKIWFREKLGIIPVAFAYPYGETDERVRQIIAKYYCVAFTVSPGVNNWHQDPYFIARLNVMSAWTLEEFRRMIKVFPLTGRP